MVGKGGREAVACLRKGSRRNPHGDLLSNGRHADADANADSTLPHLSWGDLLSRLTGNGRNGRQPFHHWLESVADRSAYTWLSDIAEVSGHDASPRAGFPACGAGAGMLRGELARCEGRVQGTAREGDRGGSGSIYRHRMAVGGDD